MRDEKPPSTNGRDARGARARGYEARGIAAEGNAGPEKTVRGDAVREDAVPEDPVPEDPVREEPVREDPVREDPVPEDPVPEEPVREDAVRLRVGQRMSELSRLLDAPSFALLLKVLGGVNAAFAQRGHDVDIDLTDEERALYTPALQREVVTLLELACFPRQRVHTGAGPLPPPDAP